jgi:hypothetical protein
MGVNFYDNRIYDFQSKPYLSFTVGSIPYSLKIPEFLLSHQVA